MEYDVVQALEALGHEVRVLGVADELAPIRDAIQEFLESQVGVSGGPVGPQERAKWIAAYRELSRACRDASR